MRLPGGYCYSHLHSVCVCMHARPHILYTHMCSRSVDSHRLTQFWCSCSPQGTEQDRRFMFSVVKTRFSRLAPCSLGLQHGHTCYSNKLKRAPPRPRTPSTLKAWWIRGVEWVPSPQKPWGDVTMHEASQKQLVSIQAGRRLWSCSAIHHA